MQKNNNIIKQFFKRFILTSIFLIIVSTSIIYFLQKNQFYQLIIDNIKEHIKLGLQSNKTILSNNFIEHIKKIKFARFEIYNEKKKLFFSFSDEIESIGFKNLIKQYHLKEEYIFPTNKEIYYNFFKTSDDKFYINFIYPVYNSNKLLGYIEGFKEIEHNVIESFEKKIIYTIVIILLSISIFSILIFPIIYIAYSKINDNRLKLLSNNIMTITILGNAIALRDNDTNEHNYRVTLYSILLAQKLNISSSKIKKLIIGAFLHDVGKIGISDKILLKNGKLNTNEFNIMKLHVKKGIEIIGDDTWLQKGKDIILYHHEKYNGSGYPYKIAGNDIPLIARIFAIVDVFDALTSKRPYKEPFSYEKAIKIMKKSSGTHFDPKILKIFIDISYNIYMNIRDTDQKGLKNELDNFIKNYFLTNE